MFIIKWRRRMETTRFRTIEPTVTGCSRYASRELAEAQAERFRRVFAFNNYFVEPA